MIKYYSSHNKELHPEALYYGARVYSDLGDYPTALKYFQEALDHLPSDTKDIDLKSRILSQTGRLLNTLRLYQEAIPYVESTLELDRQQNDTI
ncbi:MAG: tetratricopeptide repeat protein, partial [Muribaculaceae bacterium]|nr:tetratricopeptide repeat protein [Muribaculaceae bacterium]